MSLEEKMRLIIALDSLVTRKVNGNSKEYAARLGISRSTFFRLLQYVRSDLKAPLAHRKRMNRYEYHEDGIMFFGFLSSNLIPKEILQKIR